MCFHGMDRDSSIFIIKALTQKSEDKLQGQHREIRGSSCIGEPQNKGVRNGDDNEIIQSFLKVAILLYHLFEPGRVKVVRTVRGRGGGGME